MHKTIPEVARVFIDNETSKGIAVEQLRKDEIEFQRKVLDIKKQVEERIDESELYFFDRAVPDSIAYDKISGLNAEKHTSTKFIKKSLMNLTVTVEFVKKRSKRFIYANFDPINELILSQNQAIT